MKLLARGILGIALAVGVGAGRLVSAQQGNDVPLFEGVDKTPDEIGADYKFIKESTAAAGSREKAADHMIDRGWEAVLAGDANTAIHRFNQAFLLVREDFRVFWGLGAAVGMSGNLEKSVDLFKRGAPLAGDNARFFCDFGFSQQNLAIRNAQRKEDPEDLMNAAEANYTKCRDLDPEKSLPYFHLAVMQFFKGNCSEVKRLIGESRKRGGDGLDPRFLKDVETHCP